MDTSPSERKTSFTKKWLLPGGALVVFICICLVAVSILAVPSLLNAGRLKTVNYSGIASEQLKNDVLNEISKATGCSAVSLVSGEIMLQPDQSTDGTWIEVWQVMACKDSQLYSISFTPDGVGGTYFSATRADQ